ncbi:MAG: hypothetical protein M3336_00640, partial [Chloroflexota bacterium]|nr:hypothetical protein [Chloroflexota bacterium]
EADSAACLPSRLPFHTLDNVLMTPHLAGWTEGTARYRWHAIADNIHRLANGKPLVNVVRAAPRSQPA